jgi:hypothetical protein
MADQRRDDLGGILRRIGDEVDDAFAGQPRIAAAPR